MCAPLVGGTLRGFAGAVFAYGATGAGKTHTMTGLMSRALNHLFTSIAESDDPKAYEVRIDTIYLLCINRLCIVVICMCTTILTFPFHKSRVVRSTDYV